MELSTVCLCREKVRVDIEDDAAVCPNCRRWIDLTSGKLERVDAAPAGNRTRYDLTVDGAEFRFSAESTDFRVGSILSISFCQGKLIGVSDDSRKLYFPVFSPKKSWLKWLAVPFIAASVVLVNPLALSAIVLTGLLFLLKDPVKVDLSDWELD